VVHGSAFDPVEALYLHQAPPKTRFPLFGLLGTLYTWQTGNFTEKQRNLFHATLVIYSIPYACTM